MAKCPRCGMPLGKDGRCMPGRLGHWFGYCLFFPILFGLLLKKCGRILWNREAE